MKMKCILTLPEVDGILIAARNEAAKNNWPVTIAVVDDGGHLLGLSRLDGASPASASIATEKARTSAIGRRESKAFEDMINGGRFAFLSTPLLATLEGGLPIMFDGQCVGAVGVSGVKSDQDAQIAAAGVSTALRRSPTDS
ncbi:GlcG/HbpS family heme-binding protein [Paraburkholderia sp. GAS334]|uniref:GlcG/HbpS family heme-binding protein n=1 Tax=Paraburkholderia sp. GAS334 TaxID=3035131 RepID=UPI003D1FD164